MITESFFNQPIFPIPTARYLTCGWDFNQYMVLSKNITHIYFNGKHNQPIVFTENITHVTFKNCNNLIKYSHVSIDNLPNTVKRVNIEVGILSLFLNNVPYGTEKIQSNSIAYKCKGAP